PDPGGGASPRIDRPEATEGTTATTTVEIPFVALPEKAGTRPMVLPSVPIRVGRANGEVMVLCSAPSNITIDDPLANENEPQVRPDPPPRPQREEWTAARDWTIRLAALLLGGGLAALLSLLFRRPPPALERPEELPWMRARRELERLKLVDPFRDQGGGPDPNRYYDRVDGLCRQYLGERYGFDGLESTSGEMRTLLRSISPPIGEMKRIDAFLKDSDFIKYAEVEPTKEDCDLALERAEIIVENTIPAHAPALEQRYRERLAEVEKQNRKTKRTARRPASPKKKRKKARV
ncbi:MAG: hypothetical protein AAGA56_28920, partial [Myxococcota bacterium]